MSEAILYIRENTDFYVTSIGQHLLMSFVTIMISMLIGIPLGYWCGKSEKVSSAIVTIVNTFRIIPAIAIFLMLIPIMGIGFAPSIVALTVYAVPVILMNTMGGIKNVKPSVIESAVGMGMGKTDICFKVELPLALPFILTGVKIAIVETVAGASIAAFVGGGGLGAIVYMGILSGKTGPLVAGSATIALLVIMIDMIATATQRLLVRDYK